MAPYLAHCAQLWLTQLLQPEEALLLPGLPFETNAKDERIFFTVLA